MSTTPSDPNPTPNGPDERRPARDPRLGPRRERIDTTVPTRHQAPRPPQACLCADVARTLDRCPVHGESPNVAVCCGCGLRSPTSAGANGSRLFWCERCRGERFHQVEGASFVRTQPAPATPYIPTTGIIMAADPSAPNQSNRAQCQSCGNVNEIARSPVGETFSCICAACAKPVVYRVLPPETLRTAREWDKVLNTGIIDWDGFESVKDTDLMTREEFERRSIRSTRDFTRVPIAESTGSIREVVGGEPISNIAHQAIAEARHKHHFLTGMTTESGASVDLSGEPVTIPYELRRKATKRCQWVDVSNGVHQCELAGIWTDERNGRIYCQAHRVVIESDPNEDADMAELRQQHHDLRNRLTIAEGRCQDLEQQLAVANQDRTEQNRRLRELRRELATEQTARDQATARCEKGECAGDNLLKLLETSREASKMWHQCAIDRANEIDRLKNELECQKVLTEKANERVSMMFDAKEHQRSLVALKDQSVHDLRTRLNKMHDALGALRGQLRGWARDAQSTTFRDDWNALADQITEIQKGGVDPKIATGPERTPETGRGTTAQNAVDTAGAQAQKSAMTFGEALEVVKNGGAVRRAGWNGRGMSVSLVKGNEPTSTHPDVKIEAIRSDLFELGMGGSVRRLPHLIMINANGSTVTGWLASQTDMLAEDWEQLE